METSQIYIAIAIILLSVVALVASFQSNNYNSKRLSPLAGVAFGFVLAAIMFVDNRMIGYGLIGVGIILSVIDIIRKHREPRSQN